AGFRPASPAAGGDHLVHGGRAYPVLCEPGADGARDLDRVRAVTVQADRVGVDLDGRSVDRGDTAVEHVDRLLRAGFGVLGLGHGLDDDVTVVVVVEVGERFACHR